MRAGWETVIGLEIHVQLATRTKMFCGDVYEYGAEPNTRVCPVCLGLPGALPVPNAGAVERAVAAALGLGCAVHPVSVFARKNYFYPDLPKGYQITQYDRPLATGGAVEVVTSRSEDVGRARAGAQAPGDSGSEGAGSESSGSGSGSPTVVRIQRVHLEEDTGRSIHDRFQDATALDFNRAGVPLIEIVTRPDLRSPAEARAFLIALKRRLEYLEVSDCDMEKGSLRVDANVSVRRAGEDRLGVKTEVKNLNSFAAVERALGYESGRQVERLEAGDVVVQETRLWDDAAGETRPMRSKEEAHDYRYFPEPDLPPLVLAEGLVDRVRDGLPELPAARARRFVEEYDLPAYDAGVLTADRATADYFEVAATASGDPKAASNWVMGGVAAWLNERGVGIGAFPVRPEGLAELIGLVRDGTLSSTAAGTVLERMAGTGRPAGEVVEAEGLAQVGDEDRLRAWVDEALARHPDEAARLAAGEVKLTGFFVGKVMAASGGSADPRRTSELIRERAG